MFNKSALAAGALLLSLLRLPLSAQDLGNSPYSRYGLGDLAPAGFLRNAGMAGVGLSSPHHLQINELNPALLPYTRLVTFELAATSQIKRIENNRTSQQDGNAGLRYLAFAFPIGKHYTTSLGLKPFSSVSYKILTEAPVTGDPDRKARYLYQGTGGINEVFWGNGIKIGKSFSVGVQASYLFGNLTNESVTQVLEQNNAAVGNLVILTDRKTLNDLSFKAGVAYRAKISEKHTLGLAATYQHMLAFNAKQVRRLESSAGGNVDTLSPTITQRKLEVPQPMQVGLSLDNGGRWMVGLDLHTQDWSKFTSFDETGAKLQRSYRVALGGEITPDPNSVTSYLKRVTYRAGVSYGKTPIELNGTQLPEQQASFGFGLPSGRSGSAINMAFIAGTRGTTDNNLIKETFYRFEFGLSLNDRWFQQRKID